MTDARKTARSSARPRQPKPRATAKKTREATKKSSRAAKASEGPQPPKAARRTTGAALPDFVPPCLALLSAAPPQGDSWLHEAKFDGYRIQARLDRGEVQLKTRRGLDWTHKFTPVAQELARLSAQQALIDGEVVIETNNVSSFSALQEALSAGSGDFIFYAFDLLHLDGVDLTGTPLIDRKQALAQLVKKTSGWALRLSEHFETEGGVLLRSACEMGLEGIISKLRDGAYRSGRNGDWVKTKCSERQEFVIIGFAPATNDPRAVGALILGYYEDEVLKYAGRVGTGYTHKSARELWQKLNPLVLEMSPIKPLPAEERGRGAIWVEPKLVAEIDFRGWTHGMRLRHPSFKALREDKLATEIVRERPVASPSAASVAPAKPAPSGRSKTAKRSAPPRKASAAPEANAAAQMHLTNPGRVYWEDVGLTKQGLADYYAAVWDWIAPHVTGRALSLVRCPEGARKECFFQKHASAGLDSKRLRLVPEDDDHVISIDNLDGLIALVQAGVLEIHVRGSTVERLDAANRIVFDLDPAPEVGWPQVIAAARDVRERLDALGLSAYLKTTGGKGLHVVVPIQYAEWDRVKAFTRAFAFEMASDSPAKYLATASKRERTGRIFVDYLRNSREATAICAYSTRARDGATVSVPITWQELGNLEVPNRYTVANIMPRLKRMKRDPWADIGREKQKLPELPRRRK
jgi:bifunctional non-homologous end joining protein LigD